jgi:hypothetical protein
LALDSAYRFAGLASGGIREQSMAAMLVFSAWFG